MAKAIQQKLDGIEKLRLTHGGEAWPGKRKAERPITTKRAMHLVLRSSHAKQEWSFLHPKHAAFVREVIVRLAKRFGVIVYNVANAGNHIHMLARPRSRDALRGFLAALSGRLAQRITGARRGNPLGYRFFDFIPFSRIVQWGRDFHHALDYITQNTREALGIVPFKQRKRKPPPPARKNAPS